MQTFFQDNNSDELIVLFNGWGMDEKPYSPLKSRRDILLISDYSDLSLNFPIDFSKYKKTILITFSAGTFMAAYLSKNLPNFDLKISVNGTLSPLDEIKGIPQNIFREMENITLNNALDFRKKLVDNKKHYNLFNKFQPLRDLESSQKELIMLKKCFGEQIETDFVYDKVLIGENDEIIPCKNQLEAWDAHKNIHKIKGGHFLFYNFNNFDEIINF